MGIEKV